MVRCQYADVNGVRLHYASAGTGDVILFVHGFPEFWYAWRHQLAEFWKDHQAVAVDMRGYNLSSKPEAVSDYSMEHVVADIGALADHLGAEKFVLVGHDWGGIPAWFFAMLHPDRVTKLVIINSPHPGIFQREIANNPAQRKASEYMTLFRTPQAEALLSANDFAIFTTSILDPLVAKGFMTQADKAEYLKAWTQPGALTGGLNYYRASGLAGGPAAYPPVDVPTMVIWGERDSYLLTGNLDGLEAAVPGVRIERIPDASHWVVHEKPELVNRLIREFLIEGEGEGEGED